TAKPTRSRAYSAICFGSDIAPRCHHTPAPPDSNRLPQPSSIQVWRLMDARKFRFDGVRPEVTGNDMKGLPHRDQSHRVSSLNPGFRQGNRLPGRFQTKRLWPSVQVEPGRGPGL